MRTVVPKTNNRRVRFITVGNDLIVGFKEAEDRRNDDMERDNDVIGLYGSPLEIMFCPYLDGRGEREGKGNDGFVICKVKQLTGPEPLVLKGSELPVRPPVLRSRNVFQEFGGIGRKGTSGKFRGDY